ncbi:MAG: zinc-ribbon domain-containing protein [Candidatus Aminicenantaceae bacterium]
MGVKCPKCQTENPDTQRFCGDCGTQLPLSEEIPVPTKTLETPKEELTTGSTFAGLSHMWHIGEVCGEIKHLVAKQRVVSSSPFISNIC